MPVNYQLSKIYKLESPSGLIYVGSTSEPTLARRLAGHKRCYNVWKGGNKKRYVSSIKLFEEDEDNVLIYLIENFPCNTKDELRAREGFYIKQLKCVNKVIAGRDKKTYMSEHKEEKKQYDLQFRELNKEKICKKNICECGGSFLTKHKTTHLKTTKHLNYIKKPDA